GGEQRVRPAQDGDANLLSIGSAVIHAKLPTKTQSAPLGGAQLIDLAQQLFDAAAHLLAFRLQGFDFIRQQRRLPFGLGGFFHGGFPLLPQARHKLHGALYAIFQTAEGIGFLVGGAHSFSRAARADSFTARADCASSARLRKAASSCSATSAKTLRFRSMPAALRPCTNLL